MQYRQGDIFLKKVEYIPDSDGIKYYSTDPNDRDFKKGQIILAHGESTGHKHAIYDGNAVLVKQKDSEKYFLLVVKSTILKHEEHDPIDLPIGNYEVVRQREYSPMGIRRVED